MQHNLCIFICADSFLSTHSAIAIVLYYTLKFELVSDFSRKSPVIFTTKTKPKLNFILKYFQKQLSCRLKGLPSAVSPLRGLKLIPN